MRNFHIRTLADLGDDFDLRVWCLACARGVTMPAARVAARFNRRGWPLDLVEARAHFRCRLCRSSEHILLLPASKAPPAPSPEPERRHTINNPAQLVAAIFHLNRAESKKEQRRKRNGGGYGLDGGRRMMGRWWK